MAAASIVVDLLMKTGSFETDTKRAEKSLANFQKQAVQVGKAVGLAFAAVATASAAMVRSSINAADQMGKLAQKAGVSVESLSSLAYVADLSGSNTEALTSSLVKLTKNLSDANQGIGESKKGFDALGISVKNSDGTLKSADTALIEIADKFASFADGAEKTALAVNLFGKSGADLIPFLNTGAAGIKQLQQEADRLGITLSGQTSQAAAQFNDNLTRLQAVSRGLFNRIAAELLPSLVKLTESLFNTAAGANALDGAARFAVNGIKILTSAGIIIGGVFQSVGQYIGGAAAVLVHFFTGEFQQAFNTAKSVGKDFVSNLVETEKAVASLWDNSSKQIAANAPSVSNKLAAPIILAEEKVKKAKASIINEAQEWAEYNKRLILEGINTTLALRTPAEILGDEYARLNFLREKGIITNEVYIRGIVAAQQAFNGASEELKAYNEQQEKLNNLLAQTPTEQLKTLRNDIADIYAEFDRRTEGGIFANLSDEDALQRLEELVKVRLGIINNAVEENFTLMENLARAAAENVQSAFADFLFDPFQGGLKGMLQGFITMLRRMAAEALASQIFSMLGNQFGGSGGILGAFFGAFGGGRASGGDVMSGRSYLVGEHGPEMFIPRTAGTVAPNSQLTQSAPQVNVRNINVLDPSLVGDYLATDSGEQLIMNVLQRNRRALAF